MVIKRSEGDFKTDKILYFELNLFILGVNNWLKK